MTGQDNRLLNPPQLAALQSLFHEGSASASDALIKWVGKHSVVELDSLDQLPLENAATVLPGGDDPICFCAMELSGLLNGEMIMAFDDASGLALADMLLDQSPGTSTEWNEMTTSAVLETTNILCCAYLNSLSGILADDHSIGDLVPKPPTFSREFAESLVQFALMDQAIAFDFVLIARTKFTIDNAAVNWTLLFVPDADTMAGLPEILDRNNTQS